MPALISRFALEWLLAGFSLVIGATLLLFDDARLVSVAAAGNGSGGAFDVTPMALPA